MGSYIGFLILILIEWMILFSKMKLKIGGLVEYNRRKKFIILVCIEMICFAGIRSFDLGADMGNYWGSLRYYSALPHDQILKAKLVYPFDYEVGYFYLTKLQLECQ